MQQISKRPTQLHKENPKHLRPSPCPSVSSVDQKDVPRVSSRNETEWYWRLWRNLGNSMPWQSRAIVPRWRRKVTRTVSKCNHGSVRAYVWDDRANFGRPHQTTAHRSRKSPTDPPAVPLSASIQGPEGRQDAAGRVSPRSPPPEKVPFKNFEFPPTQEPI